MTAARRRNSERFLRISSNEATFCVVVLGLGFELMNEGRCGWDWDWGCLSDDLMSERNEGRVWLLLLLEDEDEKWKVVVV